MACLAAIVAFDLVLAHEWKREDNTEDAEMDKVENNGEEQERRSKCNYNNAHEDSLLTFGILGFVGGGAVIDGIFVTMRSSSNNDVIILYVVCISMAFIWMIYRYRTTGLPMICMKAIKQSV